MLTPVNRRAYCWLLRPGQIHEDGTSPSPGGESFQTETGRGGSAGESGRGVNTSGRRMCSSARWRRARGGQPSEKCFAALCVVAESSKAELEASRTSAGDADDECQISLLLRRSADGGVKLNSFVRLTVAESL